MKMAQSKNEPRLLRPIHQLFHSQVNKILVKKEEEEGEEEVREECRVSSFNVQMYKHPSSSDVTTLNYYYGPLYIVKQFAKMTYSNSTQQLTPNCAKRGMLYKTVHFFKISKKAL